MAEKLVILVTHGPEDPEMATIPFVMATAAQASSVEVVMAFQSDGVWLMMKEMVGRVHTADFPPIQELLSAYMEEGGKLYICGPCVKSRKIALEDLVEGSLIVSAATLIGEITSATSTLVY
ncbi:MAG: DsrE family protein [Chloroflexi bacterium]|nr:DsrE family protein [Chloroflexota bacterium]